jgi:hypothetical protein
MAESLDSQWKKIMRNIYDAYHKKSEPLIVRQAMRICQRITDLSKTIGWGVKSKNPGMTGNTRAGVACGVYRDGVLLGYATTADTDKGSPTWTALTKKETFKSGTARYDGSVQEKRYKPGKFGATSPYYADRRAVSFLKRTKPQYKGYSFVVVHGAYYTKYNGYVDVMTALYAELSNAGAKMMTVRLRNT